MDGRPDGLYEPVQAHEPTSQTHTSTAHTSNSKSTLAAQAQRQTLPKILNSPPKALTKVP